MLVIISDHLASKIAHLTLKITKGVDTGTPKIEDLVTFALGQIRFFALQGRHYKPIKPKFGMIVYIVVHSRIQIWP